jgi:hypothetical protein
MHKMSRHHYHSHRSHIHYGGNRGPTTLHGGLLQVGFMLLFTGIFLTIFAGWVGVLLLIFGVLLMAGGIYVWMNRPPVAQNPVYPGYGPPPQQYSYLTAEVGAPPQYGAPPPQYGMSQQPSYGQPAQPYYGDQAPPQYSQPPPPGQYPPQY